MESGTGDMAIISRLFSCYRQLSAIALDFLFPPFCLRCGSDEDWICRACLGGINRTAKLFCFSCTRETVDGQWCDDCRKGSVIRGIWAVARYENELLKRSIHGLKYRSHTVFAKPLAQLFAQFSLQWSFLFPRETLYVPVPLHEKKLRERGYNQSHLLLANFLKAHGGVCGCWLLSRMRHTKAQVACAREERLQNVIGAFLARHGSILSLPRIILIDDVATTGATLEACAHAFSTIGAHDVWGFVLARG